MIKEGDGIPSVTVQTMGPDGVMDLKTDEIFAGRRVVVFGVPGAFTRTCSQQHLPSFVEHAREIEDKGVDAIVCMSVNDAYVMDAWSREHDAEEDVVMIADGNADFTKALGLELDASSKGLGIRCKRFAMIVEDGKVEKLFVEEPGVYEVSSAENVLANL